MRMVGLERPTERAMIAVAANQTVETTVSTWTT
jgi:hypothetical protein